MRTIADVWSSFEARVLPRGAGSVQRQETRRAFLRFARPRLPAWAEAFASGPASWTVPDQVLSAIIGSGFEFGYSEDRLRGAVIFWRLSAPLRDGRFTYIDPDRRSGWVKGADDIWSPEARPL